MSKNPESNKSLPEMVSMLGGWIFSPAVRTEWGRKWFSEGFPKFGAGVRAMGRQMFQVTGNRTYTDDEE